MLIIGIEPDFGGFRLHLPDGTEQVVKGEDLAAVLPDLHEQYKDMQKTHPDSGSHRAAAILNAAVPEQYKELGMMVLPGLVEMATDKITGKKTG